MRVALSVLILGTVAALPDSSGRWPRVEPRHPPDIARSLAVRQVQELRTSVSGQSLAFTADVASGRSTARRIATDVPYLIGRGPCVAIEEGRSVDRGARLLALAPGKKPTVVTIEELRSWTGPSYGGPPRPRTDCTSWFQEAVMDASGDRAVSVKSLARVSSAPDDGDAFFALAPQPARIIIAGSPRPVSPAEGRRLLTAVRRSLPASWAPARTLVRAQRYGPTRGHQVIELSVGWPTRNARSVTPPIQHVAIRRFFLVDGRLAASEDYERTSGVEERVDTAAPELTDDNWSVRATETTLAFVSSDDGASWERLSTNVGFETTIWVVQLLREGMPVMFRRDLYTHH